MRDDSEGHRTVRLWPHPRRGSATARNQPICHPRPSPVRIDVLSGIDGVSFEEVWADRQFGLLGSFSLPFISRDNLMRNKSATGRLKDQADVDRLQRSIDLDKN